MKSIFDGWEAKQAAFVTERDRARAEVCTCGHTRMWHFERHAFCDEKDCKCGTFTLVANQNEAP